MPIGAAVPRRGCGGSRTSGTAGAGRRPTSARAIDSQAQRPWLNDTPRSVPLKVLLNALESVRCPVLHVQFRSEPGSRSDIPLPRQDFNSEHAGRRSRHEPCLIDSPEAYRALVPDVDPVARNHRLGPGRRVGDGVSLHDRLWISPRDDQFGVVLQHEQEIASRRERDVLRFARRPEPSTGSRQWPHRAPPGLRCLPNGKTCTACSQSTAEWSSPHRPRASGASTFRATPRVR